MSILKISKIIPCKILIRLNKFLVKVKIKNKIHIVSLNNTGRLEKILIKNKTGFLLPIKNPQKTKYRLSFVKEDKKSAMIIDTSLQMKCFEIGIKKNLISWLKGAKILKRNVKLDDSLIDFLIQHKNKKYYLEIKSAVMKENNFAMYPDCPSLRGQKHIKELIKHSKNSIILFIAGMKNINAFKPNKNADEKIYELLKIAKKRGIIIKALQIYLDLKTKNIILKNDNLKVIL
ncbi:MAG: DNA/RNA nuclease SfsA [Candidatus Aenigmatarchaeota archaeon]